LIHTYIEMKMVNRIEDTLPRMKHPLNEQGASGAVRGIDGKQAAETVLGEPPSSETVA